jgi:hypothetical protein
MHSLLSGAEGIRTPDLYSAIVALSQLSYSPVRQQEGSIAEATLLVKSGWLSKGCEYSAHERPLNSAATPIGYTCGKNLLQTSVYISLTSEDRARCSSAVFMLRRPPRSRHKSGPNDAPCDPHHTEMMRCTMVAKRESEHTRTQPGPLDTNAQRQEVVRKRGQKCPTRLRYSRYTVGRSCIQMFN